MLIWKAIAANPGITRAELWQRVEHGIPEGYALRLYATFLRTKGRSGPNGSGPDVARARGFVLSDKLKGMRRRGSVTYEGDGDDRHYFPARALDYKGDADAIEIDGSKAAEHLAVADALRTVEKMLARGDRDRKHGAPLIGTRRDYDAVAFLVKALRARN